MTKKILYTVLFALFLLLCAIFVPRTYPVPAFEKRATEQYWQLPTGSRIGYVKLPAKGTKKPYSIVYLHGGPGGFASDLMCNMLAPLTNDGYDIYLYDQIGSGHSDRLSNLEDYSVDRHKRDLEAIFQQIQTEKVILIAQSWGALLATYFVADHPNQVDQLVLTGPGPIYPINTALRDIKPPDSLQIKAPVFSNQQANAGLNNIRTKAMAWFATAFSQKIASDQEADDFNTYLTNGTNKSTVCDTSKAVKAPGGSGFYVSVMTMESLASMPDPRNQLQNTKVPLLLLRGQCDNQNWGFQTEYLGLFPQHQLVVIPGAGHVIPLEQPALYLKTIRNFLEKNEIGR